MNPIQRKDLILVVDDSADSLGMIHHALEQAGLTALVAMGGAQAISIAEKMTPDLILMDALMPAMDGFETCRYLKLHAELASVPIIFMTGLTDTEDVVRGLEAGGVDYVTKPVRPKELVARIRVHLNNARLAQSAHTALDKLGQVSFSTDTQGRWLWGTPQAEEWINITDENLLNPRTELAEQIQRWLTRTPQTGDQLALPLSHNTLRLRYLGESTANEHLFRLLHQDGDSESLLLQSQLRLTNRESQVLLWIAQGKTNREIGQILELSPRTVNKHLEQVFRKLGVENRTSAAAMAFQCLTNI